MSLAIAFIISSGAVFAQGPVSVTIDSQESLMEYWTQERTDNAVPMNMDVEHDAAAAQSEDVASYPAGPPGYALGFRPGEPPTDPQKVYELSSEEALTSPPFPPPTSPG